MGATSVTGVSGLGIAGNQRGPGNERNYFVPQVTPHIVATGSVACSGGVGTVYFPRSLANGWSLNSVANSSGLIGSLTTPYLVDQPNYVIQLTIQNAAASGHSATVSAMVNDANGQFNNFTIKSQSSTDVVFYTVMVAGFGVDLIDD